MAPLTGPREIVSDKGLLVAANAARALDVLEAQHDALRQEGNAAVRRLILSPTPEEAARLRPLPATLGRFLWPLPGRLPDVHAVLGSIFRFSDACAFAVSTLVNIMRNPPGFRHPEMQMTGMWLRRLSTATARLPDGRRSMSEREALTLDDEVDAATSRLAKRELLDFIGAIASPPRRRRQDERLFLAVDDLVRERGISRTAAMREVARASFVSFEAVRSACRRINRRGREGQPGAAPTCPLHGPVALPHDQCRNEVVQPNGSLRRMRRASGLGPTKGNPIQRVARRRR